jgi:hypothetical protein
MDDDTKRQLCDAYSTCGEGEASPEAVLASWRRQQQATPEQRGATGNGEAAGARLDALLARMAKKSASEAAQPPPVAGAAPCQLCRSEQHRCAGPAEPANARVTSTHPCRISS